MTPINEHTYSEYTVMKSPFWVIARQYVGRSGKDCSEFGLLKRNFDE